MPNVLWSYRTTYRTPAGETSFRLTYRIKTVVPVETALPTFRLDQFDKVKNEEGLRENLKLLQVTRYREVTKMNKYQQRVARYHTSKVKGRAFLENDLVLRSNDVSKKGKQAGKLTANWEGPYRVKVII